MNGRPTPVLFYYLMDHFLLVVDAIRAFRSIDVLELVDQFLLVVSNLLYELDGRVSDLLLDALDDVLDLVEGVDLVVEALRLVLARLEQGKQAVLVAKDSLVEMRDLVILVFHERTQHTDTRITWLAVEANDLVLQPL